MSDRITALVCLKWPHLRWTHFSEVQWLCFRGWSAAGWNKGFFASSCRPPSAWSAKVLCSRDETSDVIIRPQICIVTRVPTHNFNYTSPTHRRKTIFFGASREDNFSKPHTHTRETCNNFSHKHNDTKQLAEPSSASLIQQLAPLATLERLRRG